MASFELPHGYPEAVVDEGAVDELLKTNRALLAMQGPNPSVRRTEVMLQLMDERDHAFTPQSLANGLATLERLRNGVAQEDIYVYEHTDLESIELYWEFPDPPIYPRKLFISEWHIRDSDGKLNFLNAQATTTRPLRHTELIEKRRNQEYEERHRSFRARLGRFAGMIAAGTSMRMRPMPGSRLSMKDMPSMRPSPRRQARKRQ